MNFQLDLSEDSVSWKKNTLFPKGQKIIAPDGTKDVYIVGIGDYVSSGSFTNDYNLKKLYKASPSNIFENQERTDLASALAHSKITNGNPHGTTFLQLNETPDTYVGFGGKLVAVKADGTGLEFLSAPAIYTDEQAQDTVATMIQNGSGISWSYNDVSNTLTPTVSLAPFTTSNLTEGSNLYWTQGRFDTAFSAKSTSDLPEGSNLYWTNARGDARYSQLGHTHIKSNITDLANSVLEFQSNLGIDTTLTGGSDVLNIGTTNANVINYGNSSTVHNFLGTAIYEYQANLIVTDKLITLNDGGAIASGIGVGFEIEENNVITGYLKTNGTRNGFSLKAPTSFNADLLTSALTADRIYTLPNVTGTIITSGNLTDITTLGTIGTGVWNGSAIADTYISSAATWSAKQAALSGTGIVKSVAGTISYLTDNSSNWDTAYSERSQWDGGATGLVATTGRASLGGSTVGQNIFTATNPSAIRWMRINADNTLTFRSASETLSDIGAYSSANPSAYITLASLSQGTGVTYDNTTGIISIGQAVATTSSPTFATITTNGAAGSVRDFRFATATSLRWIFRVDGTAESGSNVGSDFTILRRSDAGADIGFAWTIKRSTGAVIVGNSVDFATYTNFFNVIGAGRFTGILTLDSGFSTKATTNPQLTANQNNYPIGNGTFFRLDSNAAINITGFTGGADGKHLILTNYGTFTISLTNEDALSTAANRIITGTGATYSWLAGTTIHLIYDNATARWRKI